MGEEDDTVDGCAADMRGPCGSSCKRRPGRRVGVSGVSTGCWACASSWAGQLAAARALGSRQRLVGRLGWLADAGRSASWEAYFFFFFFCFSFLFPLFEFKFGLEFEFITNVTYSLEFREFCLAILYNKNRCGFVVQK